MAECRHLWVNGGRSDQSGPVSYCLRCGMRRPLVSQQANRCDQCGGTGRAAAKFEQPRPMFEQPRPMFHDPIAHE